MDFHSLSRKELQTLSKKNKIPANITNVAMADALKALEIVEGIEDFQQLPESPEKIGERSADLLRTCRRTSNRTRPIGDSVVQESPLLTRTRRGTAAKASTIRRRRCEGEEQEKEESSNLREILVENNKSEIPKTPAARNGCKRATGTSVRRKIETHVEEENGEKENENPIAAGLRTCSTRRSSRLSEKRIQEEAPSIQKNRVNKDVVMMAALSEESKPHSEIKSKEDEEDTSAVLVPPKSDYLTDEICDSDQKADEDPLKIEECMIEKCGSDPMAYGDLQNIDDDIIEKCDSDESSHQNPASGDAAAVSPSVNPGEDKREELKYSTPSATENQVLLETDADLSLDPDLVENDLFGEIEDCIIEKCGLDQMANGDMPNIDECTINICDSDLISHQNPESGDAAAELPSVNPGEDQMEGLKNSNSSTAENQVLLERTESIVDPDEDLSLDPHLVENDLFCETSPKKLTENHVPFLLQNSDPTVEYAADISSSLKNLTLDCQDLSAENPASTEFSSETMIWEDCFMKSEGVPIEIPPPLKTTDPDCIGKSPDTGNRGLARTPAILRSAKVGVSDSGNLLGSKSGGVLELGSSERKARLSDKKGMATQIKNKIFEDVDKETKEGESRKGEIKEIGSLREVMEDVKVNNKVEYKEQQNKGEFEGMSVRQLKRAIKEKMGEKTKNEMEKRSALQALNENCLLANRDN